MSSLFQHKGTTGSFGAGSAQLTSATSRACPSGAAAVLHMSVNAKTSMVGHHQPTLSSKENREKHPHFSGHENDFASHQRISELHGGCIRNLFLLSSPSKSRTGCIPRCLLTTRAAFQEVGDDGGLPIVNPVHPPCCPDCLSPHRSRQDGTGLRAVTAPGFY